MKAYQKLDSLNLNTSDYLIMGTGIMFALGIRDISDFTDIDLFVNENGWNKVKNIFENKYNSKWKCYYIDIFDGLISIYNEWRPEKYDFYKLFEKSILINGYHYMSLEDVIDWKQKMNRDKDKIHIEMIKNYLNKIKNKKITT